MEIANQRGANASFCPAEPARALAAGETAWRALMPAIRQAAAALQAEGLIEASQRGRPVLANAARGPIRLRLAPGHDKQEGNL